MRRTYKYLILASSLALYAWFVEWYVFALLFLSIVVIVSNSLMKWLRLTLPVTSLVMGYILMKYAYPPQKRGDVTIEAQSNDLRLKFTIIDSGMPFDPTVRAEVDTTLSAEDRPIGGLGIHLVRKIMDSINYERVDSLNVLTLRKKLNNNQTVNN